MTAVVDPGTGQLWTVDDVHRELFTLNRRLEDLTADLEKRLREQARAAFTYRAIFNACLLTSDQSSADKRKAQAEQLCDSTVYTHGDGTETVGAAKARLDMQVRLIRDVSHDVRTLMDNLREVSYNLRAMMRNLDGAP